MDEGASASDIPSSYEPTSRHYPAHAEPYPQLSAGSCATGQVDAGRVSGVVPRVES